MGGVEEMNAIRFSHEYTKNIGDVFEIRIEEEK